MSTTRITHVEAWEAFDSRGTPTLGCRVHVAGGGSGKVIVPSGASTGKHEAVERRDGTSRYAGRGVRGAVESVDTVLRASVCGLDAVDQRLVDTCLREVDGSAHLSNLGANAVVGVSLATWLAVADQRRCPPFAVLGESGPIAIPMPMVNILSGGAHAGGAIDVQDILVVPMGAETFSEAIEWCADVRAAAARIAAKSFPYVGLVADEGGIGAPLPSTRDALTLVCEAIELSGRRPGQDLGIAIDVAAAQLYRDGRYVLAREESVLDAKQMTDLVISWCDEFPIVSIEDPLAEDDWEAWVRITSAVNGIQVLGDDLFVTTAARVERGVAEGAANAVLVKPNQVGTLTDARDVLDQAKRSGYRTVVSARSGDSEDSWLADLAIGLSAGQIKVGSLHRSERNAKWNRLLELEKTQSHVTFCPWEITPPPCGAGTGDLGAQL